MRCKTAWVALILSATLLIPLQGTAQEPPPDTITLEELQRLIDATGGGWIAGETSVSRLSPEERRRLLGLASSALDAAFLSRLPSRAASATAASLPSSIDWRDHDGDWTTPIRDQGDCGSCVAFSTLGTVESRLEIYDDNPNENPNLSEQHLFFCGDGDCKDGWYPSSAMIFMQNTGVVDEPCDPYDAEDHTCSPCADWQGRVTKIHCWYSTEGRDRVKYHLANYGPVEAAMIVYEDFDYYTSGIYRYTWGDFRGYHAVTLVGYDDSGGYWIAKNSWGTDWGENGWFRIAYGDVIYDMAYIPIFDGAPPSKVSNVRPDGWGGPYTSDTTPSFQWNPATDDADGCGVQGYYVAVDDWTPDGAEEDDWSAGKVTHFTVPNPLAEGKHTFAVTAVDKGENLNPSDSDQQGDAPYYTFYVDTTPPQSQVASLPPDLEPTFNVSWSGSDAISGIASYDVQVRDGDNSWQNWQTNTISTSATFTGSVGHTYCFRSRARDQAGSEESWPSSADTCTTVESFTWFFPLSLKGYTPPPSFSYPNDPYYDNQWALGKVEAPAAWGLSTGDGILIAVVDTGTDLDHPDLANKVRTDIDRDFANSDDVADDDHGHGTHVSGIAAAATDNSVGVAGVGWEATILPLKVLREDGYGPDADLAAAIRYAADNGATVINMSLGGAGPCPSFIQEAVDYAYNKGTVLIAAAGNHKGNEPGAEMFPANCEHVLAVTATDPSDSIAYYSNYGNHINVAAPGSGIYSTRMDSQYGTMNGTSMAAPHVAGLAALLRARYPSYTPDQVASAILDNAKDLGAVGWDEYYGCGRINAFAALRTGAHGPSPLCLEEAGLQAVNAAETATHAPFVPGEIIVSFQPGVNVNMVAWQYKAGAEFLPDIQAWRLRVPSGQELAILAQLRADPAVAHADLNHLVSAQ